jgi:ABC-type multidrug transport system ATPase subunit
MKGISGGQKRRLSVASQLMTRPQILFLDEPTSGLDSAASFEIVSYLKKVAREENVCAASGIQVSYSERIVNVLLTANVFPFR